MQLRMGGSAKVDGLKGELGEIRGFRWLEFEHLLPLLKVDSNAKVHSGKSPFSTDVPRNVVESLTPNGQPDSEALLRWLDSHNQGRLEGSTYTSGVVAVIGGVGDSLHDGNGFDAASAVAHNREGYTLSASVGQPKVLWFVGKKTNEQILDSYTAPLWPHFDAVDAAIKPLTDGRGVKELLKQRWLASGVNETPTNEALATFVRRATDLASAGFGSPLLEDLLHASGVKLNQKGLDAALALYQRLTKNPEVKAVAKRLSDPFEGQRLEVVADTVIDAMPYTVGDGQWPQILALKGLGGDKTLVDVVVEAGWEPLPAPVAATEPTAPATEGANSFDEAPVPRVARSRSEIMGEAQRLFAARAAALGIVPTTES